MNMDKIMREEARLIVLRELHDQPDGRSNSSLLGAALESYGIAKPRSWLHDELNHLAMLGAVTVRDLGTVRIAEITQKGADHVERRLRIEGVKRPSASED